MQNIKLSIKIHNFVQKDFIMNIQEEKIEIMKLILETNSPSILESIKGLFNRNKTADFWETLPNDQKDDIMQGINEIENGEVVDFEDFMKKYR